MSARSSDRGTAAPLRFPELVDLECLLLADRDADPSDLLNRDGELGERIGAGVETDDRHELFRRWIRARLDPSSPSPGQRVSAYYRLFGWMAAAAALVAGGGTAAALLRYDGGDPVNILGYLAVFVGLQLLLVTLSSLLMIPRAVLGRLPALGGFPEFIRQLGYRRAGLDDAVERARGKLGGHDVWVGRLLAGHAVYSGVERWMLTAMTQRAGAFFNLGALTVTLYLLSVRALAFAWSTTLTVEASTMTRWLRTIATPWFWLTDAVPDEDLVAASRYFPGSAYDPDLLGDWWPFLVAALVCYGLLPRTALAVFAAYKAAGERRKLELDHADAEALYERLMRRSRGWAGDAAVAQAAEPAVHPAVSSGEMPSGAAGCVAFAWAGVGEDAVREAVGVRFGWRIERTDSVSGSGDAGEQAAIARLGEDSPEMPVVVVAEAWEPPSKGLLHFLGTLRSAAGGKRAIVILLLGGEAVGESSGSQAGDLEVWRQRLGSLGDPYLRIDGGLPS
jgi:hypothetical protein